MRSATRSGSTPKRSPASACSIAARGPTPRVRMARPSASSRRRCGSGRMPSPIAPPAAALARSAPSSHTTTPHGRTPRMASDPHSVASPACEQPLRFRHLALLFIAFLLFLRRDRRALTVPRRYQKRKSPGARLSLIHGAIGVIGSLPRFSRSRTRQQVIRHDPRPHRPAKRIPKSREDREKEKPGRRPGSPLQLIADS